MVPQLQGNSSPHSASQSKGHHLPKGYFEPACVPRASAGPPKGDTALLEPQRWEGGSPQLQPPSPALLPPSALALQGEQLPHTSQC